MFSVTRQHRFRSSLLHAPLPFIFPWHQNFELRLRPLYGCFLRRSFCCNVFGFRLTSDYISCCLTISLQRAKSTTVSRMWQKKKKKISAHEVFFFITVTGQTRKARYQKKESAFFFFLSVNSPTCIILQFETWRTSVRTFCLKEKVCVELNKWVKLIHTGCYVQQLQCKS